MYLTTSYQRALTFLVNRSTPAEIGRRNYLLLFIDHWSHVAHGYTKYNI